jgi:hypothetical protein
VNRRASLPGADELFRGSGPAEGRKDDPPRGRSSRRQADSEPRSRGVADASGRTRHDQKITVYLTEQELLDLEQARLQLRAEFDIAIDRGRLVREAVAELLQDLHDRGPDSTVVRRLS